MRGHTYDVFVVDMHGGTLERGKSGSGSQSQPEYTIRVGDASRRWDSADPDLYIDVQRTKRTELMSRPKKRMSPYGGHVVPLHPNSAYSMMRNIKRKAKRSNTNGSHAIV